MKITICDDSMKDLATLEGLLEKDQKLNPDADFQIDKFSEEIKEDPLFPIKTKTGLQSVPCSKIEYIENASRMLNIHLTDGSTITSIFIRKSFEDELKQLIQNKCFLHVHKSFLVNLNHVKKLDRNIIIMNSGANIPVSKKNKPNVKKQYLLFVSKQS